MPEICYYSNYCEPSKKLLQKMAKTKLKQEIHFISIDQREVARNGQTYIIFNQERLVLPSNISRVPALFFTETNKVLFGDDIYSYLLPKEQALNHVATAGQGEPECFSIQNMCQLSDNYSFLDQSPEDLYAKGNGGMRQLRHFSSLQEEHSIHTPDEDYVPDKVGLKGKSLEEFKAERDNGIPHEIKRL
jgi:hypothetical protein